MVLADLAGRDSPFSHQPFVAEPSSTCSTDRRVYCFIRRKKNWHEQVKLASNMEAIKNICFPTIKRVNFIATYCSTWTSHISIFYSWKWNFFIGIYLFRKDHGSRISEGDNFSTFFSFSFYDECGGDRMFIVSLLMMARRRNMNNKFVLSRRDEFDTEHMGVGRGISPCTWNYSQMNRKKQITERKKILNNFRSFSFLLLMNFSVFMAEQLLLAAHLRWWNRTTKWLIQLD